MGRDKRGGAAGTDVTGQLLRGGQLRRLRRGLGGLIRKGIVFSLRLTGQKIQQLRLCGLFLHSFGGFGCGPGSLHCCKFCGLPLHGGDHVLAGLGGAAVKAAARFLQAAGRLAGGIDVEHLCLGLFLGGQLCLLQIQNGLLRVHAAVHSGGVAGFTSAKQHDDRSSFYGIYSAAAVFWA